MPEYICTKICQGPIISLGTKWTTGFRFYTPVILNNINQ